MLSADASTSPWNRTSPSRPASATATALRSFATSIPTNASLISAMVRPPMVRRGSYHSPGHRGAASLIRVAPHRERTYGLTFHNGSAATLPDVVRFYDERFKIGLSAREKADLAAFLGTL